MRLIANYDKKKRLVKLHRQKARYTTYIPTYLLNIPIYTQPIVPLAIRNLHAQGDTRMPLFDSLQNE